MATTALHPDGASGRVTDRSGPPPGAVVEIDKYKYKYLVAIAVSLAAMLELIDTSIVNVAIPHMMGNLGATLDEIAWVSTSYIIANVIVIPLTGWLGSFFGRKRYFVGSIILFTIASFFCGALVPVGVPQYTMSRSHTRSS